MHRSVNELSARNRSGSRIKFVLQSVHLQMIYPAAGIARGECGIPERARRSRAPRRRRFANRLRPASKERHAAKPGLDITSAAPRCLRNAVLPTDQVFPRLVLFMP